MAPRKNTRRSGTDRSELRLSNALLLNRYMLSLFGATSLEALGVHLKDESLEGYDRDNISLFHHAIAALPIPDKELTADRLLVYDRNIARHTAAISSGRRQLIRWKYFQYLSLLFTEIYLDRYFNSRDKLLADIQTFRRDVYSTDPSTWHGMTEFTGADLNKLAYWSATGSGKTLLMHVNILQYRHYAGGHADINRTILVTPNSGLTRQHLDEFKLSGIPAEVFSRSTGTTDGVDIIEITRLAEKDGDKTVAVGAFETNNLVLVDEGHRGSTGDTWKTMRDCLSADGFAFEYSATFGQAVSSQSSTARKKELLNEYGRATLFDYSYRHFHGDGYGKDYRIFNLGDTRQGFSVTRYLTACLLGFYEQMRLYIDKKAALTPFMIEKPLAVFVGSTVSASPTNSDWRQEMSDIVYLLDFFSNFISRGRESADIIGSLLEGTDGLVDKNNNPIFARSFSYIRSLGTDATHIYRDMLRLLFNCDVEGATLHLDHLRGSDGEIGMRIGNAPYFGIISVGDSVAVINRCAQAGISTMAVDYSDKQLFATINTAGTSLNMLIGSKKFTEGWSSWRVSTMGLLNVGRSEGSQVIQLFGRGVRLKGYGFSLKRSSALDPTAVSDAIPEHIGAVETLNVFGVRADYMELFEALLQEEGIPTADDGGFLDFTIPVIPAADLADKGLKYLRLRDGKDFRSQATVDLDTDGIGSHIITLDCYPRVAAMTSDTPAYTGTAGQHTGCLTPQHLQFIDWNRVFFSIEAFKSERKMYNLSLTPRRLRDIASDPSWYRLLIPARDMEFTDYSRNVALCQDIVTALLKLYVERAYSIACRRFTAAHIETAVLDTSHPDFETSYRILYHKDLDYIAGNLAAIKRSLDDATFGATVNISNSDDFQALFADMHLYQPLLYLNPPAFTSGEGDSLIKVEPAALNSGERTFVNDIRLYHDTHPDFFADKQLYLLRNKSRRGIGFYEMAGFYPDFIIWLIAGGKQYISFVDPKGISHLRSFDDDKVQLHTKIRTVIEPGLADPDIILNSFIVAVTPFAQVSHWAGQSRPRQSSADPYAIFNDHHIYFQTEQSHDYIEKMLHTILRSE